MTFPSISWMPGKFCKRSTKQKWRTGDDAFELSVFRGFSANFWDWLTTMSEEFGYQVS